MTDQVDGDPMPVFVIKGKDLLAPDAIAMYRQLCLANGLTRQAAEVDRAYAEVEGWQARNPDAVWMPDHTHVPAKPEERS